MEFHEKLLQLRKRSNMTQEELAEKLYVSRTAVSKWEGGKGYPNIESLKRISGLFSVSVDELLTGEELVTLAGEENERNLSGYFSLICGVLDVAAVTLLFLPLYGQAAGDAVRFVPLAGLERTEPISLFLNGIMLVLLLLQVLAGVVELAVRNRGGKTGEMAGVFALLCGALAILLFIAARQPYAAALLFLFLMGKVVLLLKRTAAR